MNFELLFCHECELDESAAMHPRWSPIPAPHVVWLEKPYASGQAISQEAALQGGIIEMVIWRLPGVDPERPHGLKYRLAYVKEGGRLVGYDNERGKGDHKHIGEKEQVYVFQNIDQLLEDLWNDVKRCEDD